MFNFFCFRLYSPPSLIQPPKMENEHIRRVKFNVASRVAFVEVTRETCFKSDSTVNVLKHCQGCPHFNGYLRRGKHLYVRCIYPRIVPYGGFLMLFKNFEDIYMYARGVKIDKPHV